MKQESLDQRKMYLLDANIFLEVELAHSKGECCKEILKKFYNGDLKGLITSFHIDTIIIVMENYKLGWDKIKIFLSGLLKYKGLTVELISLEERIEAIRYMEEHNLDYDDALTYSCMKNNNIREIISYDSDFDSIPKIKRVEPEKLL